MSGKLGAARLQRWKPLPELKLLSDEEIVHMVTHLQRRAVSGIRAAELAERLKTTEKAMLRTPEAASEQIALVKALYESGRITQPECLFFCVIRIEDIHESRWFDGRYEEIEEISNQMEKIKKQHGLADDEEWEKGEEPEDYKVLSYNYNCLLHTRFEAALREFDLIEEADLWRDHRAEFERRREIGRSVVFDQSDMEKAVLSSVEVYEREAHLCGDTKAFYAACVMLGSAVEARLLLSCLQRPEETRKALDILSPKAKPKNSDPLSWSLDHLVSVGKAAGWLVDLQHEEFVFSVSGLLSHLRKIRNHLHPGRHAKDRPHAILGEEAYADAIGAYSAFRYSLEKSEKKTTPARGAG